MPETAARRERTNVVDAFPEARHRRWTSVRVHPSEEGRGLDRQVPGDGRSGTDHLLEEVVDRGNVRAALMKVKGNKGSPGVDGMTVEELPAHLVAHWEIVRAQLLDGSYQPQPVRSRKFRRAVAESESLGFPPSSIGSSSRPSCRCYNRDSIRRSPSTATAFDRGAKRTMRCARPSGTSNKAVASSSTWTSNNSSIE